MIPFIKFVCRVLAAMFVLPLLATYWCSALFGSRDSALESHSQLLSLVPGTVGSYVRVAFYSRVLDACHPTSRIAFGVLFSKTGARIGQHVYVGPRCHLGLVTLEEDVLLGPAVQIPSGRQTHGIARLDVPIRLQAGSAERITVGRDCWIGGGAVILADLKQQTVVGAASVVTRTPPARTIVGGNPAEVIRQRLPSDLADTPAIDQTSMAAPDLVASRHS